jgi:uncharacterized membrane protein YfcA
MLGIVFGMIVGFSLGLTGGGGSIFAVPLLVYGLSMAPREAVALSLAAVGATALVGAIERLRAGEVEVPTALIFSAGGVAGAPLGAWIGGLVPDAVLLLSFAVLIVVVAARMWARADRKAEHATEPMRGTCPRDIEGRLHLGPRCAARLVLVGLVTGVLSGLLGVGGGFVIVPALVFSSGMPIHRAVATSLLAIALVSASGVTSFAMAGRSMPPALTALFVVGGVGGMRAGTRLRGRLPGPLLQKGFAVAIVGVAAFIVSQRVIA